VSVMPWATSFDCDCTAGTAQTLTDGPFTFPGLPNPSKINSANQTAPTTIGGANGLSFSPNATGAYYTGVRTMSGIWIPSVGGVANIDHGMRFRNWMHLLTPNACVSLNDSIIIGVDSRGAVNGGGMGTPFAQYVGRSSGNECLCRSFANDVVLGTTNDPGVWPTHDVFMMEWESGTSWVRSYSGVWSGGWPAMSTMQPRSAFHPARTTTDGPFAGLPGARGITVSFCSNLTTLTAKIGHLRSDFRA
jgi:hypothetical protein